jgi:putative DNA primase/helicase
MSNDTSSPDSTERFVIGGVDGYPAFYFRPLTAEEQAALAEQRRKTEADEVAKQQRHRETLAEQQNAFEELADDDDDERLARERDPDRFRNAINDVAKRIFGEPNRKLSKGDELRYNARGSLCVYVSGPRKGVWKDFETGDGGGCLDLVVYGKQARDHAEAAVWCEQRGYIPKSADAPKPKRKKKRVRGDQFLDLGKPAITYDYVDATGELLYQGCRFVPKAFRPRQPDGKGSWIWDLDGLDDKRVLFRLPELLAARAAGRDRVVYCEGEKDTLAAVDDLNLDATCHVSGTGGWRSQYVESLRGIDLVIVPHNDDGGRKCAVRIAAAAIGVAKRIRIVKLWEHWKDCPEKGDLHDWVHKGGGTREAFDQLVEATPDYDPELNPPPPEAEVSDLPVIKIVNGKVPRAVDEAEAALLAKGVAIMTRAGTLVRPIKETFDASDGHKTEQTILRPVGWYELTYLLEKYAARLERYDGRLKMWVATNTPERVAKTLLAKGQWSFPRVKGVISAPTMRPDGTLIDRPGYDTATQLWYEPDSFLQVPPIADAPTREEALAALKLFEDLVVNFPFETQLDRAVALAALLTPLLRAAADVVPMVLFLAHVAGSGKSYLIDLISTLATGRRAPAVEKAENKEELEKRLGALVLAGVPIINIDNCTSNLGGTTLCQMTERELVRIRILGRSEAPEVEYRGSIFANGNNITAEGDLTRRTLVCHIDPGIERPELRRFGFDPITRVLQDRGKYVAAALTIARAYRVFGGSVECAPIGSYGRWSMAVREPLIWLGKEDSVRSMDELREEDPVRAGASELYRLWKQDLGLDQSFTAAEVTAKAQERSGQHGPLKHPELHALLMIQAGGFKDEIDTQRAGIWLRSVHGQVHDGLRLERIKGATGHQGAKYALRHATTQRKLWK